MLPILYGERNKELNPPCPVCNSVLVDIRAGLYCYTPTCPAYMQKAIACCEGGPIQECTI